MKSLREALENTLQKASKIGYSGQVTVGSAPITATSDHVPVLWSDKDSDLKILSWNMLSDEHLYNAFLNVANIKAFERELMQDDSLKDNLYSKKLNMFFYELSEFTKREQNFSKETNQIIFGETELERFLASGFFFPSPKTEEERNRKQGAREEMMGWFKSLPSDGLNLTKHDFSLAVAHSLQILHHIEFGGLKWSLENDSRLQQLRSSEISNKMKDVLDNSGFICLQECTDPNLVFEMLNRDSKYKMLSYSVREGSKDNCVMIYNADLYDLEEAKNLKLAHDKKKPAIVAKFSKKETGESLVVGSIHHPGGHENDFDEVAKTIKELSNDDAKIAVSGDFNHTKDYFLDKARESKLNVFATDTGTMAANDYGNRDVAIDLVFSNVTNASIKTMDELLKRSVSVTADVSIVVDLGAKAAVTLGKKDIQPKLQTEIEMKSYDKKDIRKVLETFILKNVVSDSRFIRAPARELSTGRGI